MKRQPNGIAPDSLAGNTLDIAPNTTSVSAELELDTDHDGILTPEFLLEHLEGELEASLHDDLELLLMNSIADRRVLKSLEQTREILKASDDSLLPEDGHFYERLHAKIMRGLPKESANGSENQPHDALGRGTRRGGSTQRERQLRKDM